MDAPWRRADVRLQVKLGYHDGHNYEGSIEEEVGRQEKELLARRVLPTQYMWPLQSARQDAGRCERRGNKYIEVEDVDS